MSESRPHSADVPPFDREGDTQTLLGVLDRARDGDFTARMPLDWTGIAGKVGDAVNDLIIANQILEKDLARVSDLVEQQDHLSHGTESRELLAESSSGSIKTVHRPNEAPLLPASHLDAIVESSHAAIFSKDLNGLITSWNRAAEVLYGYTLSEVLGKSDSVLVSKGQEDERPEVVGEVRLGEFIDIETIRTRKDGSHVEVSLTTSPIVGSAGQVIGMSIIARDNSRRRMSEHLKDEFMALVSHELRTPLSSIVAHIDLLLDDEPLGAERSRRFLEVISRNSGRLERLVGDLLFVAQIESTSLSLLVTDLDIVAVAKEAIESMSVRALQSDIDVTLSSVHESLCLRGDPGRLGQAIDNLISNAIKYSTPGTAVAVRIKVLNHECAIEVEDHGIGIAADDMSRLFDRFFRGSNAKRLNIQGVGLGLLIVKKIIEGHGGKVAARSERGVGTTFRIVFPLIECDPSASPEWSSVSTPKVPEDGDG